MDEQSRDYNTDVDQDRSRELKELDSRMVTVRDTCYFVEVRQGLSELLLSFIECFPDGHRRKLSIPFNFIQKVIEIFHAVMSHNAELSLSKLDLEDTPVSNNRNPNVILKTWTVDPYKRKRFFFDLSKDVSNNRFLKIATLIRDRKITVHLSIDSLSSIVDILEQYSDKFLTLSNNTTSVKTENVLKSDHRTSSRPSGMHRRQIKPMKRDSNAIQQLDDPEPKDFKIDQKRYKMQLVKTDTRAFLRISEYIGNRLKASLHIPYSGYRDFQDTFNEFADEVPEDLI